MRNAQKFLGKGHRVKLTLQFRGREMEFQQIGREMFQVGAVGAACSARSWWRDVGERVVGKHLPGRRWLCGEEALRATHARAACACSVFDLYCYIPPALLQRFVEDCGSDVSIEQAPQMQGRQMTMVLAAAKKE